MPNPYIHAATWWRVTGADGYGGSTFAAPQPIFVRWEDRQEKFIKTDGEEDLSKAILAASKATGSSIKVGDYVFLGTSVETNPQVQVDSFSVRQKMSTPDLRNVRTEVRLIL